MNGSLDRKVDKVYESLSREIEDDRATIRALGQEIHQLRSQQTAIGKKLDALIAQANEKKELERIAAISDVVKNDKSYKIIAIVTSALGFVAIVFAVLLALFWRK